jgi:Ca-activated chloride channel family protein
VNVAKSTPDPPIAQDWLHRRGRPIRAFTPASGTFAEGMARIGGRGYRRAIAVFEKVLALEPGNQTAREQPATGEDAGIGVDEVVFDDEAVLGAETVIAAESTMTIETADQWMRSLDRRRAGLLRFRFALEAARCEP